jgi:hypothetical protein
VSPRAEPFVPKLSKGQEARKRQLIMLGMHTVAASFEAEAERAAKGRDATPRTWRA